MCDEFEGTLGGWESRIDFRTGDVEISEAISTSGDQALASFGANTNAQGTSAVIKRFELPDNASGIYATFDLYVESGASDDYFVSPLLFTDTTGRRWRLNMGNSGGDQFRLNLWTARDGADDGIGATGTRNFETDRWHCVQVLIRADRANAFTLDVDGERNALVTGVSAEGYDTSYTLAVGLNSASPPKNVPTFFIDDIQVGKDPTSC